METGTEIMTDWDIIRWDISGSGCDWWERLLEW